MILFASQSGNPVLGLLLLPLFFAGPFVLVWLEVRAVLKSEAQSWLSLSLLIVLGVLACLYGYAEGLTGFRQSMGFTRFHILTTCIGAIAWPISLGWEVYKRGWVKTWTMKKKKKRRAT